MSEFKAFIYETDTDGILILGSKRIEHFGVLSSFYFSGA